MLEDDIKALKEFAEWNRKGAAAAKLMFETGGRVILDPDDLEIDKNAEILFLRSDH